jgi:RDD family
VSVASKAWRRIGAWSVDWLIISVYVAALIPLGLLLVAMSVRLPLTGWNALSFALLVVPTTVWMAAWEAGPRAASPGKRLLRLRVGADNAPALGWRRALVRNGLKIALPWEVGHTAAFTLADPQATATAQLLGMVCGVAACVVVCVYIGSLFIGRGWTPYDRASGSRVAISD